MSIFSRKFLQKLFLSAGIFVSALSPAITHAGVELAYADDSIQEIAVEKSAMPLFTPFNWSAQPAYIIQGTMCTDASGIGSTGCSAVTFVIDPPNHRMLMDLGAAGKYYILEHESFITNVLPTCARVLKEDGSNFTFADQVAGYMTVLSTPTSTTKKPTYFGRATDVGGCQDKIAVEIQLRKGFLSRFYFVQLFPIPGIGCSFVTGFINFKKHTIDTTSPRDHYFVLPTDCTSSAINYCSNLYYPGNPCDTCH